MNKQKWLKPLRVIVALLFLAGFIVLFSDVKAVIPASVYSVFTSFQLLPSLLKFPALPSILSGLFILILILTLLSGRVYCSVFCPLGIMQDLMAWLFRKIPFLRKVERFRKPLNYLRYPILILFLLSFFFFGLFSINLLDPYATFGRIASNLYQPVFIAANNVLARLLTIVGIHAIHPLEAKLFALLAFFMSMGVFLLILAMVFFRNRLYCNTICPVGAFLGLLSRISIFRITIKQHSCTQCGKCQVVCKANCIDIKNMKVDVSRCVDCYNCIDVCTDEAIGYDRLKRKSLSTEKSNSSKRDFLKAGLLFMGAAPLIAHARGEGHGGEHHTCFWSRGPISPPGSLSIEHLKDKCIACHLCVSSCPSKVLQPSFLEYGFTGMLLPQMDNKVGFCNYECTMCGDVCPTGAIFPLTKEEKETTQIGTVTFRQNLCIVESEGTACGSCSEHCPTQAVYMVPYKDDLTIPEVNPDICVGCGACEYACPVEEPHVAIFVAPQAVHQVAQKPVIKTLELEDTTEEEFPF